MHKVLIAFTFLPRYRQYSNYDFFGEALISQIFYRYICIFNGVVQQSYNLCVYAFTFFGNPDGMEHIIFPRFVFLSLVNFHSYSLCMLVNLRHWLSQGYNLLRIGIGLPFSLYSYHPTQPPCTFL